MAKDQAEYKAVMRFLRVISRNSGKVIAKVKLTEVDSDVEHPDSIMTADNLRFAREMLKAYRILERSGNVRPALQVLAQEQRECRESYETLVRRLVSAINRKEKLQALRAPEFVLENEDELIKNTRENIRNLQGFLRALTPNLRKLRRLVFKWGPDGWLFESPAENQLFLVLFGWDHEAALKESMEAIEEDLGESLLKLAEDENLLQAAIAKLVLKGDVQRRLVHAGVMSNLIDDDYDPDIDGKREVVEYVLSIRTAYHLAGISIPLEDSWERGLRCLMPRFSADNDVNDQEIARWIMRQQLKTGVPPHRTQMLMRCLHLDVLLKNSH